MRAYKVVKRQLITGKLISAVTNAGITEYKPNEWVSPINENGPLCCFEDLRTAKVFKKEIVINSYGYLEREVEIWECEIVKSKYKYIWINCLNKIVNKILPEGTVLADKVKLIKRIL